MLEYESRSAKTMALLKLQKARETRDASQTSLQRLKSERVVLGRVDAGNAAAMDARIAAAQTQLEANEQSVQTAQRECDKIACEPPKDAAKQRAADLEDQAKDKQDIAQQTGNVLASNDDTLPVWAYVLIAVAVLGFVAGLAWFLTREPSQPAAAVASNATLLAPAPASAALSAAAVPAATAPVAAKAVEPAAAAVAVPVSTEAVEPAAPAVAVPVSAAAVPAVTALGEMSSVAAPAAAEPAAAVAAPAPVANPAAAAALGEMSSVVAVPVAAVPAAVPPPAAAAPVAAVPVATAEKTPAKAAMPNVPVGL